VEIKPVVEAAPKPEVPKAEPPPPPVQSPPKPLAPPKAPKPVAVPKKPPVAKPAPAKPVTKTPAPAKQPAKPKATPKPVAKPKPAPVKASPAPKADNTAREAEAAQKQKELQQQQEKEAAQKQERQRQQKLIAEAQESIAKIGAVRDTVTPGKGGSPSLTAVSSIPISLHIDAMPAVAGAPELSFKEVAYRDELAGRLKLFLKLPEYGDVKVKLTLERSGKVVKVVVDSAESATNKKYIEKTLPTVSFPPFGSNFGSDAQYTFSITLSNE
jgi:colicin import membrane protein